MGKRILLVDDEPLILKGLKYTLEQEGYETDSAMDGEEALARFETGSFDLILLDVMLPKLDGIAVCQRIREHSDVPIIMLTAKGEDMDKILGLEYGADDYMTKPFNILEVKARIKTILRRVSGSVQQQEHRVIRVHDMEVNLIKRSVTLGGQHDDRNITAFTDPLADSNTIQFRQHHVQKDKVKRPCFKLGQGFFAVHGAVCFVAFLLQRIFQAFQDQRLVIHKEDPFTH